MKKQNIIMGISFVLLFVMVMGVSYAAYKFSATGTKENVISTGKISMSYKQNSFIDLKNTYPKTDIYAIGTKEDKSSMEFSVSMETSGTKQINYVLALTEIQEGETLKSDKVKIYLEKEGKVVNNFETNKGKTIESFKNRYVEGLIDSYAIYQDILTTSNKTHHYTLTAWIDESYILPIKNETTTIKQTNEETYKFKVKVVGVDSPITIEEKEAIILDTSGANAPVLASNMIPVYYDETSSSWKKADVSNTDTTNPWYSYNSTGEYKGMWANAVTVKDTNRQTYLNAIPGTIIPMDDINTMWVWIPRFNAVTPSNYNGGTESAPAAIDVTFVKQNETAIDAFTFGNKELSGFWYGKFEVGHTTLASIKTENNLGCTNETCSNANGIIIKPNVTSLRYNNVSNFFYASRSMEQSSNSFGFVSSEVDTHMSKNNEWGAVAYLTQSIYGRCTTSTSCSEVYINNSSGYYTGRSGGNVGGSTPINGTYTDQTSTTKYNTYGFYTYDDYLVNYNTNTKGNKVKGKGTGASTTGNIYGIYDMSGGSYEWVMGVYTDGRRNWSGSTSFSNSGFTGCLGYCSSSYTGVAYPESKYYNKYTTSSNYTTGGLQHTLIETKNWYSDVAGFVSPEIGPWFSRGGGYANSGGAGVFFFNNGDGYAYSNFSVRLVITNE